MWPDFPEGVLYAHSFKTHFSLPSVSYINGPTVHMFNTAEGWTVSFHSGLFLKPVWHPRVGKQTADCELPHNWLMSLSMDLAVLCDMWRWKSFGCFYWRSSLCPSICGYLPASPSYPIGVKVVLATPVKKLSKWRYIELNILKLHF